MRWIEEDFIEYEAFDTITLFRDSDNKYMKMVMKVFTDDISAVVKGEYIELNLEKSNELYFAFSVSDQSGITLYKIYKKKKGS